MLEDMVRKLIEAGLPEIHTIKVPVRKTIIDENGMAHEVEETLELPSFDDDDTEILNAKKE